MYFFEDYQGGDDPFTVSMSESGLLEAEELGIESSIAAYFDREAAKAKETFAVELREALEGPAEALAEFEEELKRAVADAVVLPPLSDMPTPKPEGRAEEECPIPRLQLDYAPIECPDFDFEYNYPNHTKKKSDDLSEKAALCNIELESVSNSLVLTEAKLWELRNDKGAKIDIYSRVAGLASDTLSFCEFIERVKDWSSRVHSGTTDLSIELERVALQPGADLLPLMATSRSASSTSASSASTVQRARERLRELKAEREKMMDPGANI